MRQKGDPEQARQLNIALILNLFKVHSTLSRTQIARELNLSKMTVSTIVTDLIKEEILTEIGEGRVASNGGRRPILLNLAEKTKYVIGIDVGRTNIAVVIAGISGNIILQERTSTCEDHSLEKVLEQLKEIVERMITTSGIPRSKFIGIGYSMGGLVDKNRGHIDLSPDFEWKDVPMQALLEKQFKMPVVIDNCTRAMALGELWHGSAKEIKNLFYVSVGFGVGSAIVVDHQIYENNSEFGHIYITQKPVLCDCGMQGCLEAVASGQAIGKEATLKLADTVNTKRKLSGKDVHTLALEGNDSAKQILNDAGRYLGRALSFAANIFHPQKILIGGGVTNAGEYIYDPMMREFLTHTMEGLRDSIDVEFSKLGDDSGMLGSLSLALDTFVFKSKLINR
jgi:predicted NBD/HSP70 family sugar kinase